MASRDELYCKYGITAEAAQLFETELGTLLLTVCGLENSWHVRPDALSATKKFRQIDKSTLGGLLSQLRKTVTFDEDLEARLTSALEARNRLVHGFYERHNFKIQTEQGRDAMISDLENLHEELFQAWQVAGAMSEMFGRHLRDEQGDSLSDRSKRPPEGA